MTTPVSDSRSNKQDQIVHAAEVLSGSSNRLAVFEAVYQGKRNPKTREEIEDISGLDNKQVLNAGKKLVQNQLISQEKIDGQVAYRKDQFFATHKAKILRLARNPDKLRAEPTKVKPETTASNEIRITVRGVVNPPERVTVDDFDSFSAVTSITAPQPKRIGMPEEQVKNGFGRIIGEEGEFKDWGGEINDMSSSRVRIAGKRRAAAFAFKGPGATGKLTPGKMGKNGDQIQRLFDSDAEVFIVQYIGEISESVFAQMSGLAVAKAAATGKKIWYGIIDGQDTSRLIEAYPEAFACLDT